MAAVHAEVRTPPTRGRELLEAIADAIARPGVRKRFLDSWRETARWPASYRRANARLSQWLDPQDPHRFPVEALPDLIRAVGDARMLDGLLALEALVARARRGSQHEQPTHQARRPAG